MSVDNQNQSLNMKKIGQAATSIIFPFFLASCSSEIEKKFEHLCETEAVSTIHRKVSTDGFYDSSISSCINCWYPIVEFGYSYLEFCQVKERHADYRVEAGCWRFFRSYSDESICKKDIEKYTKQRIAELGESYCIALEKIEAPTSRYESKFKEVVLYESSDGDEKISEESWEVRDKENNTVMAFQKNFEISRRNHLEGGFDSEPCNRIGTEENKYNFFTYALLTRKDAKND